MSFEVKFRIAPSGAGSIATRRCEGQVAVALDEVPKFLRVAAFVEDANHDIDQKRQRLFGCSGLNAPTHKEEEGHDVSFFINNRGGPRVVPASVVPYCVILRASDQSLARLVGLNEGAFEGVEWASRFLSEVSKNFGPEAGIHPTELKAVGRVRTSLMRRKALL